MESRLSIYTDKTALHDKGWLTSAFIPRTPDGPAAAPRMKAPGSSSFCATVFMSYSCKQVVWQSSSPIHCRSSIIIYANKKQVFTLCFWATGIRYGTPPTSVMRGLPHKPAVRGERQYNAKCTQYTSANIFKELSKIYFKKVNYRPFTTNLIITPLIPKECQ